MYASKLKGKRIRDSASILGNRQNDGVSAVKGTTRPKGVNTLHSDVVAIVLAILLLITNLVVGLNRAKEVVMDIPTCSEGIGVIVTVRLSDCQSSHHLTER